MANRNVVVMENVRTVFRNFEGREGRYNKAGDRNFSIVLDESTGKAMEADEWNVKWFKDRDDREEGDPREAYLEIKLEYDKGRPPKVVLISSITGRRNYLTRDTIEQLDFAEIVNLDLTFRPYHWSVNGNEGIKAYLQTMYVTINEDPLDAKYDPVDETPAD